MTTRRAALPTPAAALLVAGLVLVALPATALARQSLHGKWAATLTADDGGKDRTDTFEFTNGDLFTTDQMKKDGFAPAPYAGRGSPIGAAEQFEATQANPAGDTAKWQGQNLGNELSGTLTLTRKGEPPATFTFKAVRK